ncbi:MAG: NAD-dependent epimerase/dehydratase family protein [Maribacter sp.]|nr:NAD-dependent epimerase/dehydratase family protein [Maribacter sp.]
MKILLTGATGFIGRALVDELLEKGHEVNAIIREISGDLPTQVNQFILYDLGVLLHESSGESLEVVSRALQGVEVVIHTVARVHILKEFSIDPLSDNRRINRDVTLTLATKAAQSGIKRFVFLSSIKANGESTQIGKPFTSEDDFVPDDPYGLSKYEAEVGLFDIARTTNLEVVVIRPPLVYGPGVKANFLLLLKWVEKGIPLPFGLVKNSRSLIALKNLVHFIGFCADFKLTPGAANEVFLISDGEDISTTDLIRKIAKKFHRKILFLPVPVGLMSLVANIIGKKEIIHRLFRSLQVDDTKARIKLGWKPVTTMDKELAKTVKYFLTSK